MLPVHEQRVCLDISPGHQARTMHQSQSNSALCSRPQEGLFGLREWEEEGFVPEAVPGHPQPQPLTLKGMQFELNRVRPITSECS